MHKIAPHLAIFLIWISCSTVEENISFDPGLQILFSNDSVAFDTLLSESRSPTRRLTVFNPNRNSVLLSEIFLGQHESSDYSIVINGKEGTSQVNEEIFGGDSLLILVEVNITPQNRNDPYLVKDSIVFSWNGNTEHVKLVSWGQDGNRIQSTTICDETWTNSRPYIISNSLQILPDCQLTLEPGTRVFMENDAVLFVQGTLNAVGDSANHIIFRNSRFDGVFDDQVPGQWDGIYFLEGSTNNQVEYAEIFNAQVGLRVGSPDEDNLPDVVVRNTEIYNMSFAGILAFTSDLVVSNTLIYNCGSYLVGNFAGGNYTYQHCTFSNDASFFIHDEPGVQFSDNIVLDDDDLLVDDLDVELTNCIIWGSGNEELLINNGGGALVTADLRTNIIRSSQDISNNFTSLEFNFPGFMSSSTYDYSLDSMAFARDKGTDIGIPIDFLGNSRDITPDIGAFEYH